MAATTWESFKKLTHVVATVMKSSQTLYILWRYRTYVSQVSLDD